MICTVTPNTALDKVLYVRNFCPGHTMKADVRNLSPAGKGINVARGLARLGTEAVACGFVGERDLNFFQNTLRNEGIKCKLIACCGKTRTNTSVVDIASDTDTTHLREPGFEISNSELAELENNLKKLLTEKKINTVAFCGSLPPGFGETQIRRLVKIASERGKEIVFDVSDKAGVKIVKSGAVNIIKPNLEELEQYLGRKVSDREAPNAAQGLLEDVDVILLTVGDRGAFEITSDGILYATFCQTTETVKNTVGCGDAFLAGWLFAREKGLDRSKSLLWGVACGTASAMSDSTVGYSCTDVEQYLQKCEIQARRNIPA